MENSSMLKAYIINLSSAKERKERMQEEIARLGGQEIIEFCFYEAIAVGSEKFREYQAHYKRDFLTQLYRGKRLSEGEKACFASHYSLWQKCVSENRVILILEDDIAFLDGFVEQIQRIESSGVDFVRLMSFFQKKSTPFNDFLNLTKENICGTQGYYLSPNGAKKLLAKSKLWLCPVDNYLDKSYIHTLPNLISNPEVIKEMPLGSCIGGGGRNQKPKIGFIITREIASSFEFIWRRFYEITH